MPDYLEAKKLHNNRVAPSQIDATNPATEPALLSARRRWRRSRFGRPRESSQVFRSATNGLLSAAALPRRSAQTRPCDLVESPPPAGPAEGQDHGITTCFPKTVA